VAIAAGSALPAANFFPLEPGNTWTYRNRLLGDGFTVRIGPPAVINGNIYYALQGYVGSDLMVRVDDHDNLVYLDNLTNDERILVWFGPADGRSWFAPYRTCDQESQTQEKRNTYNGPSGEFRNVLDVRFHSFCADAGTLVEQFAENIGMLRRVEESIAGPRQYDLVYARVGSMVLNALPTGLFSVTLDQPVSTDEAIAVLRLRLNGLPLKLAFSSAQEFEVVLRDEGGGTVWRWSDGRIFDQATHEQTIFTDWTVAVPVPRPSTQGPKNYTLQAWLTTTGPLPPYVSTVPVTIDGSAVR
jgi:hypothetical protein